MGQEDGLQSLGLVGLLVRYSTDVHAALNAFVRHLGVHVRGAHATLAIEGKTAILSWEIHEPGVDAIDQVGDGAIAVYCNILRELCGPNWKPTEAWFAHRRPANVSPFRQFFQVPLRFDAEQFALLFSADVLKRRLPRWIRNCRNSCSMRLMQSSFGIAATSQSRCAASCAPRC